MDTIIQQNGLPLAAIISIHEYEEFMAERQEQRAQRIEELSCQFGAEAQRRGMTEEQLLASIQEAKPESG